MFSCPDPVNCPGNLRTLWYSSEEEAVERWNVLVDTYRRR